MVKGLMITKKFSERVINYIFDNWEIKYVLDQLSKVSVDHNELHEMMGSVNELNPNTPRNLLYNKYKKELRSIILSKNIIIDV